MGLDWGPFRSIVALGPSHFHAMVAKSRAVTQHLFQYFKVAALIGRNTFFGEGCDGHQARSGHGHGARGVCKMNTAFLLMAQYNGKATIPINDVCRDYFPHLRPSKLVQKILNGEIAIPLVRIESSQKSAKGVHLADLAEYLEARAEAARKDDCPHQVKQQRFGQGPRRR
jgi:hypothetical protein